MTDETRRSPAETVSHEPRFFIDHGMIHDRVTGCHVTTEPDTPFCDGIVKCCALLNALAGEKEKALTTLATAMRAFVPDLVDEFLTRYRSAMAAQDERLEVFLAFLRSNDAEPLTAYQRQEGNR